MQALNESEQKLAAVANAVPSSIGTRQAERYGKGTISLEVSGDKMEVVRKEVAEG